VREKEEGGQEVSIGLWNWMGEIHHFPRQRRQDVESFHASKKKVLGIVDESIHYHVNETELNQALNRLADARVLHQERSFFYSVGREWRIAP